MTTLAMVLVQAALLATVAALLPLVLVALLVAATATATAPLTPLLWSRTSSGAAQSSLHPCPLRLQGAEGVEAQAAGARPLSLQEVSAASSALRRSPLQSQRGSKQACGRARPLLLRARWPRLLVQALRGRRR